MDFVNFNKHIVSYLFNEYGGSEKKKTIILDDGNKYMLKFPDPIRELNHDISYINNAISEYIGCQIFKSVGFDTQNTILGEFTDENNKTKTACACRDIREKNEALVEMEKIYLEYVDDIAPLSFSSVKQMLKQMQANDVIYREYCRRFIIDALIGNTDRHNGNWGFLINNETKSVRLAPVYDCGSSLYPLLSDEDLLEKQSLYSSMAMSVASVIKKEDGGKIIYSDYLLSNQNSDINTALKEVVPFIDMQQISNIINKIPYISDIRKNFYTTILWERYDRILIPALENSLGIHKSSEYKKWSSKTISKIYNDYISQFSDNVNGESYTNLFDKCDKSGTIKFLMENGSTKDFEFIKNSGYVFFTSAGECKGLACVKKSNLNVCKFVQSARSMGINIDSYIKEMPDLPPL